MRRIAIINQRYGMEVNGGSEYYTRLLAEHLKEKYEIEVLTTCALDYMTWENYYQPGVEIIDGITVRRFQVEKTREKSEFDAITCKVLDDSIRTKELEYEWIDKQGPYTPQLIRYVRESADLYDCFVFVTYLYYLTAVGMKSVACKSILIPTAHDEPFLKFSTYRDVFTFPKAYVFLTPEEELLVYNRFNTYNIYSQQTAIGVDVPEEVDSKAFLEKYNIVDPYMVYVGRIDEGKGCHTLFDFFLRYKADNADSKLKLVLMGKSVISIPKSDDIISLGFVSDEDKYNGIAASEFLVLPSKYESLSISVLEAMALNKPVLVNGECNVLRGHCKKSNAGLYYGNYAEFASSIKVLLERSEITSLMKQNAKRYIDSNYRWDVVLSKFDKVIDYVCQNETISSVQLSDDLRTKKIGFVTPWFGMDIQGGAEAELRDLVLHLKETELIFEVLTTCVKSFNADWNVNFHNEGLSEENGIKVRRFAVDVRNVKAFDEVNAKLMRGIRINNDEQKTFIHEMVNSTKLYDYMQEHDEEFALYVFIPYMFGTTYFGAKLNPDKAVLIPCFHDESYFYMDIFKDLYSKVAGIVYNAQPEKELVEANYCLRDTKQIVMGIGMDTNIVGDAERFRKKHDIKEPFILYAGRKDVGKNVDTLINYFCRYKEHNDNSLKLLLIGGGSIDIPPQHKNDIIDLGFIAKDDKYDACSAALAMCQPSHNESFSLVIMESWLCKRPVIVNASCAVTRNFVVESNGGLYFDNYYEWEADVNYFLNNPDKARQIAEQGYEYVLDKFDWEKIKQNYITFFNKVVGDKHDNAAK